MEAGGREQAKVRPPLRIVTVTQRGNFEALRLQELSGEPLLGAAVEVLVAAAGVLVDD
jgi:hypothetical protein